MREPTEADRYLLWLVPPMAVISEKPPSIQDWHWRYKGPPSDPIQPSPGLTDGLINAAAYSSSLAELEALGWLWRGEVSNDAAFIKHGYAPPLSSILRGFGMQEAGLRARASIVESGEPELWKERSEFWGVVLEKIR